MYCGVMPRFYVPDAKQQRTLTNIRKLLTPGGASQHLRVSRQAVMESASRPGGRLLLWVFGPEPGGDKAPQWSLRQAVENLVDLPDSDIPRKYATYVDFGQRKGLLKGNWDTRTEKDDAYEWQGHDPAELLAEAERLLALLVEKFGPADEDDDEEVSD